MQNFFKRKKEKKGSSSGANKNLVAMISEINLLEDDNAWWVDSGATKHVCKNKNFFKTMKPVEDGTIYSWEIQPLFLFLELGMWN